MIGTIIGLTLGVVFMGVVVGFPIYVAIHYGMEKLNNEKEKENTNTDHKQEAQTMYKAKNGFTLLDATTPQGWTIQTAEDIVTALLAFPAFQTVAAGFIWEAIEQATNDRKEYANITELAEHLAANYI